MKKTYQLKTNAIKGEQQLIDLPAVRGKEPVKVNAAAGARYEVIETAKNAAPDNIRVLRKGKNLHLFFDGESEPGLVLENFYAAHTDNLPTLIGRTEQGVLLEYIPENASPGAVVTQLSDSSQYPVGLALGGLELPASGAAVALLAPVAAAFSPWLLGAGVLGAAALAAGAGGGSGGSGGSNALLKLNIDLDSNNNNYISATEKGTANTTSVTAQFDKNTVAAGQVLTFTDGTTTKTHTLVAADVAAGKVTIPGWPLPGEGQSLNIKATLSNGSKTISEATDTATLDTTAPNGNKALGLKMDLDTNSDGVINGSEKGRAQTSSLTASFDPSKVSAGDKVIFSDGVTTKEVVLTESDVAAGKVSTSGWPLPAEDATRTYVAVLTDAAGNPVPEARKDIKLDAVNESLKTALLINPITGDNMLSLSEQATSTATVTGKVSGIFAATDVVTLMVNGKTYTTQAGNGNISTSIAMSDLIGDPDNMIEASINATKGQLASAAQSYALETAANAGAITSLSIDAVSSDNIINAKEIASQSVLVTGQVSGKFDAARDKVTLLINDKEFAGTIGADGKYQIAVPTEDLQKDGDTTVNAYLTGTGGSSAKAAQNYGLDIQNPTIKITKVDSKTTPEDANPVIWTLDKLTITPDEVGSVVLHIGSRTYSDITSAGVKLLQNSTELQLPAKDIWLEYSDKAGNTTTAYLTNAADTTLYTVSQNTVFFMV